MPEIFHIQNTRSSCDRLAIHSLEKSADKNDKSRLRIEVLHRTIVTGVARDVQPLREDRRGFYLVKGNARERASASVGIIVG